MGWVSGQAGVIKPWSSDVAVVEAFLFTSIPAYSEGNHLLIAHTLRRLKAENPDIAEVGGENLTALSQPLTGDDKHQNTTGFQPAVGVAQECLLSAATVSRPRRPIVRWIQIQEAKALNGALHFQRISLDDVGDPISGLLGAVGVKLDTEAKHLGTLSDRVECHTISDAGVEC